LKDKKKKIGVNPQNLGKGRMMTQCDAMMLRCHFSKYLSNQSNPKNIKQSANTSPVKCSETLAKAEFRVSTGTQELTENTTDAMGTCDDEPT